ncbi:hypothetical protein EMCRGX_G014504 [Ephydatia muelleri]
MSRAKERKLAMLIQATVMSNQASRIILRSTFKESLWMETTPAKLTVRYHVCLLKAYGRNNTSHTFMPFVSRKEKVL